MKGSDRSDTSAIVPNLLSECPNSVVYGMHSMCVVHVCLCCLEEFHTPRILCFFYNFTYLLSTQSFPKNS